MWLYFPSLIVFTGKYASLSLIFNPWNNKQWFITVFWQPYSCNRIFQAQMYYKFMTFLVVPRPKCKYNCRHFTLHVPFSDELQMIKKSITLEFPNNCHLRVIMWRIKDVACWLLLRLRHRLIVLIVLLSNVTRRWSHFLNVVMFIFKALYLKW